MRRRGSPLAPSAWLAKRALVALAFATLACARPARGPATTPARPPLARCPPLAARTPSLARPRLMLQDRHAGPVTALALSPSGRYLASEGVDRSVRVWDVASGAALRVARRSGLLGFADEGTLAIGASDAAATRWSIEGGADAGAFGDARFDAVLPVHGGFLGVSGVPGDVVVSWLDARAAKVRARPAQTSTPRANLTDFAASADGAVVVAGGARSIGGDLWEDVVFVLDPRGDGDARAIYAPKGDGGESLGIIGVAASPSGDVAYVAAEPYKWGPRKVVAIATQSGRAEELPVPERAFGDRGITLAASPDGGSLALSTDTSLVVWDLAARAVRWRATNAPADAFGPVAFAPDGATLFAGTASGDVAAYDVRSGRLRTSYGAAAVRSASSLVFLDKDHLAVAHRELVGLNYEWNRSLAVWSLPEARRVRDDELAPRSDVNGDDVALVPRGAGRVTALVVKPSSECYVEGKDPRDGVYAFGDGASAAPQCLSGAGWGGSAGVWVGSSLLGVDAAGKLLLYTTPTGGAGVLQLGGGQLARIAPDAPEADAPHDLALSADGAIVVGSQRAELVAFSPTTGAPLWRAPLDRASSVVAVARDHSRVALASAGEIRIVATDGAGAGPLSTIANVAARGGPSAFGADPSLFVTASGDELVVVRDGAVRARGASDGGMITKLALDPTDTVAATIGDDGAVRIWDVASARVRGTLADFRDGEWVLATPEGRYAGTSEVADRIGWVFPAPLEHFGFEQFSASFHDPSAVAKRLAGSPPDAAAPIDRPPGVRVESEAVAGDRARVRVRASSHGRVDSVRAFVEARPEGEAAVCASDGAVDFDLPLLPGTNRAAFVAFDDQGWASNPAMIDLVSRGSAGARPRAFVVAVGIDRYPKLPAALQLGVAAADARAVDAAFRAMTGRTYASTQGRLLTDDDATPDAIRAALSELAAMGPNDVAVVFFAGHGFRPRDGGDMVLVTSGVELGESGAPTPASLARASVGWTELGAALARARGRVVVLLDACHSGDVVRTFAVPNDALASSLVRDRQAGAVVFAASKGRQVSYEPNVARALRLDEAARTLVGDAPASPHGYFTGALLAALAAPETDRNGDGAVQLSELVDEVTRRVTRATSGAQTPWVALRGQFGDFTIATVASAAR